jgi:hypothetical protein
MIQITTRFSNRIIKKGDYFTIYIDITNGHEKEISLSEVKISQPMGFLPVTIQEQKTGQQSLWTRILKYFEKHGAGKTSTPNISSTPDTRSVRIVEMNEKIQGASLIHEPNTPVQPKTAYSEIFYLKAGWSGGLRPRPDTYTISCDVTYELEGKSFHNRTSIDISIFPSLGSMLVGTIVGSVLGTLVKELLTRKELMHEFQILGWEGTILPVFPILFTNVILGFIVAVVLMRKKDVQPFLTIEDFWGGILVGFLTSYTSAQLLGQLSKMQIINPTQ